MAFLGQCYYRICVTRPGHAFARSAATLLRSAGALGSFRLPLDALNLPHGQLRELMRLWRHTHWSSGDGMMPPRELLAVYKLACECPVDGLFVELGAWKGLTTCYLAAACRGRGAGGVVAVDTFAGTREFGTRYASVADCGGSTLPDFENNIRRAQVDHLVTKCIGRTTEVVERFRGKSVGLLLIDADHSYQGVKDDFEAWYPLVAPGGIVVFHDYTMVDGGVSEFVDREVLPRSDLRLLSAETPPNLLAVTKIAAPVKRSPNPDPPPHDRLETGSTVGCTVVVTVLNDAAGIVELLDALVGQTRRPAEVVVVDGGSTDGTFELLERIDPGGIDFRYVQLPGVNIAEGRNHGISLAKHEIIVCTDSGCVPDLSWLENLTGGFDDPDVAVVAGAYRMDARSRLERVVGFLTLPGQLSPVEAPRFNPSARSVAFRIDAWRRAGGFPEWLYTAEDTLFDCKMRRNGEVFSFASDAIVRWRPRKSWPAVWRQFRNYARGEARIGRGKSTFSYWMRRYCFSAVVLAAAALAWMDAGNGVAAWAGMLALCILLVGPFHSRAASIAARSWRLLDYPASVAAGHWVALSSMVGYLLGRHDRRAQPRIFVDKLRKYWGTDSVGSVPAWRMKRTATPRTLLVAWHWPPTNRASAAVLANLFHCAPGGAFRVLTRAVNGKDGDDPIPMPPLRTDHVNWPRRDDGGEGLGNWLASVWTTIAMVYSARRIHKQWPVQRVLAIYPHRFGLCAGWLTARRLGVPLVAYMHDLFAETLITRSRCKRAFWSRVDRAALESANLVAVPTTEFADHYRQRNVQNLWVLPHCRPMDVERSDPPTTNGSLQLLYAGSVYQAHQGALAFLAGTLKRTPDLNITYLTRDVDSLPGEKTDWLDRSQAFRRMHESDVLVVLLSRDSPYPQEIRCCFPSKVVDYLAVGRPILAIVPPDCFVDRLIRETGCGVSVNSWQAKDLTEAIDALRDPLTRQKMAEAATHLVDQLAPAIWMRRLCGTLACGPPDDPCEPGFPRRRQEPAYTWETAGDRHQEAGV